MTLLGKLLCQPGQALPVMEMAAANALQTLLYAIDWYATEVGNKGRDTLEHMARRYLDSCSVGWGRHCP